MRRGTRWTTAVVTAALVSAGAAGCSDDNGDKSKETPSATVSASLSPSSSPSGSASASPSASAGKGTLKVDSTSLGKILTDGEGRTLYLFKKDKSGKSSCTGACAQAWPPFTVSGKPQAGDGVKSNLLGVTTRSDTKSEVTYNGHPLYYYAGDQKPGDVTGQGLDQFGAKWWVLDASGNEVTKAPGAGSSSPSTSSSPSESSGSTGGGY